MNFSISKKKFSSFLTNSKSFISSDIKLYYSLNTHKKIGFIVNKSFGSAVKRNRFKRQCRNVFLNSSFNNKNFVVIIKPLNSKGYDFDLITNFFNAFIRFIN